MRTIQIRHLSRAIGLLALGSLASIALAYGSSAVVRSADRPLLETADARKLSTLAASIASSRELAPVKAELAAQMRNDPQALTSEGRATLAADLDEIVLNYVTQAVTSDTARPALLWWNIPPYKQGARSVPGARANFDNPNNVYQIASLDPKSRYVIKGTRHSRGPAQVMFVIYPWMLLNKANPDAPGMEEATLAEPVIDSDGSYTVTIGPEPAGTQPNYIQNTSNGRFLLVRQALADWSNETPDMLEITRVSPQASSPPLTRQQYIQASIDYLREAFPYWLGLQNRMFYRGPSNALPQPRSRPNGWGLATFGHFEFEDDEALVVTIKPMDAPYVSAEVYDPWMVSRDYLHRTGSLNKAMTRPDGAGNYTYVIAAHDPGVHNWLDTDGLNRGFLFVRWQPPPSSLPKDAKPIESIKVVKLSQLAASLPPGTAFVSADERRKQQSERLIPWARRLKGN